MSLPDGNYVLAVETKPRGYIVADTGRNRVLDGLFRADHIGEHLFQVQSFPTTPTSYTIMHVESGLYVATDPVALQNVVLAPKGSLPSNLKWNLNSLPGPTKGQYTYTISNVMSSKPLVGPGIGPATSFFKVPADNTTYALLQQEIASHKQDNANFQATISSLQSSLTNLQNSNNSLRADVSNRDATINQLRADIVTLNNTISSNTATINSLQAQMRVRGKTAAQWESAAREIFRNGQVTVQWQAMHNGVNQANKVYWSKGFEKQYG